MKLRTVVIQGLMLFAMLASGTSASFAQLQNSSEVTPIPVEIPDPIHGTADLPTVQIAMPSLQAIKGLTKIEVLPTKKRKWHLRKERAHWYLKKDGTSLILKQRLKKVPDLRPQEEIHPKAAKWRERIVFWGPIIDFGTGQAAKAAMAGAVTLGAAK